MGQIVGPDGNPADLEPVEYDLGGFEITTPLPAEAYLSKALELSRQAIRRQNPVAAMNVNNPFQMEPGAQAVFMLAVKEISLLKERLANLEAKLPADAE